MFLNHTLLSIINFQLDNKDNKRNQIKTQLDFGLTSPTLFIHSTHNLNTQKVF